MNSLEWKKLGEVFEVKDGTHEEVLKKR